MASVRQQTALVWGNLGQRQKIVAGVSALVVLIALAAVILLAGGKGGYVPLFTQLEAADAGAVVEQLGAMNVSYRLAEGGSAILVPSEDVYEARLALAKEGLPKGSIIGFEIFDQTSLGTTDFVRRVQYLRGLQGELSRTITQIDGVEQASVHIVIPESSLYTQQSNPPTAAVLLKLGAAGGLEKQQVRGIVHLISRSVEGLQPENVTVLDAGGTILSSGADTGAGAGGLNLTLTQLEMQTGVQQELERKVQTMLEQVLGPGNVVTRVNAALNFDQKTVSRRYFEPVGDTEGILRSVQELRETFAGQGTPAAAGTPGIPGYPAAGEGTSTYTKTDTVRNYEVNETSESVVVAPGSIERLTVAVMVNRERLSPVELKAIETAVAATIGSDAERSDQITVAAFPFDTSLAKQLQEAMAEPAGSRPADSGVLKGVPFALAALLLLVGVFFLRQRHRREAPLAEVLTMPGVTAAGMEAAREEAAAAREEGGSGRLQKEIERLVRQSPEEIARLVKTWLAEDPE